MARVERVIRKASGFTLLELLVVFAIIAILAGMLIPAFAKTKEEAEQEKCLANLKQIGQAIIMYTQDYDGWMRCATKGAYNDADAQQWFNWASALMTLKYVSGFKVFQCPTTQQVADTVGSTGSNDIYFAYGMRKGERSSYWRISEAEVIGRLANVDGSLRPSDPVHTGFAPAKFLLVADTAYGPENLNLSVPYFRTDGVPGDAAIYLRHTAQANCLFGDGHAESILGSNLDPYKIGSYYDETGNQIFP